KQVTSSNQDQETTIVAWTARMARTLPHRREARQSPNVGPGSVGRRAEGHGIRAVVGLEFHELLVLHLPVDQGRKQIAVRVEVTGTGGTLVVDRLPRGDLRHRGGQAVDGRN